MSPKRTGKIDKELKTIPYIIPMSGADDDIDLLKSFLEKNALTSADFASFLKITLETVTYPYASENRRKPPTSTMRYLQTHKAEGVLFECSVIDELYQAVKQNEAKTLTRNFFKDPSQDDQPRTNLRKKLRFYEEVREEVFSHIQRVRDSRASWADIEPTTPAAPCTRMLCAARRRPCSNRPCHAVRPDIKKWTLAPNRS
jgi:hypothetical protein